jgi:probable rRNA maturation factor
MTEPEDPGPSNRSIEVLVSDEQPVRLSHEALVRAVQQGCEILGAPDGAMISLSLVTPLQIADLKLQALGVHASTDVLSYPIDGFESDAEMIGDLVICPEVAIRQGAALGREADEEVLELLAHGLLHIAGRDHFDPETEVAMALEQHALASSMGGIR